MPRDTPLRAGLLAVVVLVALLGVASVGAECQDTLALQGTPAASFDITYDDDATKLTITHDGGDTITDDQYTVGVAALVTPAASNSSTQHIWANETVGGFPITPGSSITLQDTALTSGATIQVVHRGYEIPRYCPQRGAPQRIVLDEKRL